MIYMIAHDLEGLETVVCPTYEVTKKYFLSMNTTIILNINVTAIILVKKYFNRTIIFLLFHCHTYHYLYHRTTYLDHNL